MTTVARKEAQKLTREDLLHQAQILLRNRDELAVQRSVLRDLKHHIEELDANYAEAYNTLAKYGQQGSLDTPFQGEAFQVGERVVVVLAPDIVKVIPLTTEA